MKTKLHKRVTAVICCITLLMTMYSCQKEEIPLTGESNPITEARQFFENKSKASRMTYTGRSFLPDHLLPNRDIDWHSAFYQQRGDTVSVFVPIRFPFSIRLRNEGLQDTRLNDLILLRMTKPGDNARFTTDMLTLIPDQPWLEGHPFSGGIIVEDWFRPISNYYSSGPANETKPVLASSLPKHVGDVQASASGCTSYMICVGEVEMISLSPQRNIVMSTRPTPQASSNQSGEICYTNNYCPSGVSDGSGDIPYNPPPLGGGGGSGSGGSGASAAPSIPVNTEMPWQDSPEIDVQDYIDCFGTISNAGATYKVTVYVQEPSPGTNKHFGENTVGHAAIGLTKTGSNGQSITQILGFYPEGANIFKEFSGPSKIVDNGRRNYEMEYTIKMDFNLGNNGTAFQNILNNAGNPSPTYHALVNNCVKYVLDACTAGGLSVPFAMSSIVVQTNSYNPAAPTTEVSAYMPAGMAQAMRSAKAQGDNRINTANNAKIPTGKGPC